MAGAIWGEPDFHPEEGYPLALFQNLLQQTMTHYSADGACLALFEESLGQMVVQQHVRFRQVSNPVTTARKNSITGMHLPGLQSRRTTSKLTDPAIPAVQKGPSYTLELEDVPTQSNNLFPQGATYFQGDGLIGTAWLEKKPKFIRHEDYLTTFHLVRTTPLRIDVTPSWYMAIPLFEPDLQGTSELYPMKQPLLGILVLYQTRLTTGFSDYSKEDIERNAERLALYIQNSQMRKLQQRSDNHLKQLQQISTSFPIAVKLADLFENVYQFAASMVDVSSIQITLYDRDTQKIYDVFAIRDGQRVEGLPAQSVSPSERPIWWNITQKEKRTLSFQPGQQDSELYDELLTGVWGDQHHAGSFLLLPMKMFKRVIGALSITSKQPNAYRPEEILVLETMVQIITVSIENAKLYDRAHQSLTEAKQREELLAAMNSALQSISLVLNVNELLHNFVEFAANLVQAEMSVFFQLTPDKQELIARTIYAPVSHWENEPDASPNTNRDKDHTELIEMIRLPYTGTILESRSREEVFYYLGPAQIEELAQVSSEGGSIFLRETHIEKMLMLPVQYQSELVGILAVHTPRQNRVFRPKEVGMLMAICAQTASAIRNAQLFEEVQEANAELQRMDKLKDEFLVTASHELRTPLSAISGYSSLLKRQSERISPQQILRFATKIANSAEQLRDLVANMTEAAKLGAVDKKIEMQLAPTQLFAAIDLAITMISAEQVEHRLIAHVPDSLWVQADIMKLKQVITNLVDNAVKYSPPGTIVEIEAEHTTLGSVPLAEDQIDHASLAELGDNYPLVLVRVHDQGDGILPDDQLKIFEKFVRAERSLTTPIRGSGLGLYICRRLVEAMGGKLWLEESIPSKGSTFSFFLPQVAPAPKQEPVEQADEYYESAE